LEKKFPPTDAHDLGNFSDRCIPRESSGSRLLRREGGRVHAFPIRRERRKLGQARAARWQADTARPKKNPCMASELVGGRKTPSLLYHSTKPEGGKESRGHTCRVCEREREREREWDGRILSERTADGIRTGMRRNAAVVYLCMVHARMPRQGGS
jgi:hypothetical protein